MQGKKYFAVLLAVFLAIILYLSSAKSTEEKYRDPIWMNRRKLYDDQYARSNGSIYGNCRQPWDMFSGFPVYPKAY